MIVSHVYHLRQSRPTASARRPPQSFPLQVVLVVDDSPVRGERSGDLPSDSCIVVLVRDQPTGRTSDMPVMTRSVAVVGRACAAAVLGAGALLTIAGPASAAPAAAVAPTAAQAPVAKTCAPGHKYTVTVGGTDGCNAPPSGKELNCYKGAAAAGSTAAAGASRTGAGPVGTAEAGGIGAVGGCYAGATK
jgi:hypothetical protein